MTRRKTIATRLVVGRLLKQQDILRIVGGCDAVRVELHTRSDGETMQVGQVDLTTREAETLRENLDEAISWAKARG